MKDFNIINGTFKGKEALDIINSIIQSKIQFHHLRSMADFEMGIKSTTSEARISDLKDTQRQISDLLNADDNSMFRITGEIKIEKL